MLLLIAPVLLTFLIIGFFFRRWHIAYRRQVRIRHLRAWATQNQALDSVLQLWIQQLSTTEIEVLLDLLHGYCISLQWELDWLFTPQIESAPALQTALQESVSAYLRTILLSLQMEEDVRAYHAYLAFDKQPNGRQQRMRVQQLYTKIHGENVPLSPKGFFRRFSRAAATRNEQVAKIRQAFGRDPARTMVALKAVLAAEEAATAPSAHPTPTAPVRTAAVDATV